jgi:DNA processing protein
MLGIGRRGPRGAGPPGGGPQGVGTPDADTPTTERPDADTAGAPGPGTTPASGRTPDATERDAWVVLASVDGLGPVGFGALLRRFGDGRAVLDAAQRPNGSQLLAGTADRTEITDRREALGPAVVKGIIDAAAQEPALICEVTAQGLTVLTLDDPRFPARLLAVEMPPHLLFVRGDVTSLAGQHAIAVVGTRRPTEHGRRVAARIASALTDAGATVVSGLAVGIDGAAHAAAVAAGGRTVAVLGGGHGRLFPQAHTRLAEDIIASGGAVVSELFPSVAPTPGTFPRRNRIISGLTDATVVVEAPIRSGALITASWALEQGRECFIVPGPLDARTSAGSLRFLRDHAGACRLVAGIPELIEDLDLIGATETGPRTVAHVELGPVERALVDAFAAGASTSDDLVRLLGQPVATILSAITMLELRGLVVGAYGRYRLSGRLAGTEVA